MDFFERMRHDETKSRLKAAFRRKPRPAKVTIKDDIRPAEAHRRELIDMCEQAIEAQKRIIEHDGPLEAHKVSLGCLEQQLAKLNAANT